MTTMSPARGAVSWKFTRLLHHTWFDGLSCPSAKLCFAVDYDSVLYSRTPTDARSWHAVGMSLDAQLVSISCPSVHFCAVVASDTFSAEILTAVNPTGGARAWHATDFSSEGPEFGLSDISCPSVRLCDVGEYDGNIFTSTHPARRGWARTHLGLPSGGFDLRRLSCPSSRLCVSVSCAGIASSTRPAAGAKAWTISLWPTELPGLPAVACTRSLCVVGDSDNNLMVSSRPAAGASAWARFDLDQGYNAFASIACSSTDVCVASDNDGNLASSTNPIGGAAA